ncbi:DEKNAAC105021 [Brettanomyces naardenensis]|uniref:DEKNAAC105021 n=1 Tax=Brettanomyces naardenensis TaxID=13370 RepID=A0A448YS32_BRENA|nr:DEKNAAC105021 [Brettanomyces naardenensis]
MVSLLKSNKHTSGNGEPRKENFFRRLRSKTIGGRSDSDHEMESPAMARVPRSLRTRTSTISLAVTIPSPRSAGGESPVIPIARARVPTLPIPAGRGHSSSASTSSKLSLSTPKVGLPSIDDYKPRAHKMTYNPYGLGSTNAPSRVSTTSSLQNNHASFDSSDDEINVIPYPVDLPNDHLPPELKTEHQNLFDDYQFLEDNKANIGTGASALVKKVARIGHPRDVFALKKFVLFKGEKPEEFYSRAAKEYIIHHNLNAGLHVVTCHALVKIPHQRKLSRGWGLILELCKLDLFDLISKPSFAHVSSAEKLCLFKQIAYGVKYIHECDIVHRDLKPENVLLTSDGVVKITDFGVADYGHEIPGDFSSSIKLSTQIVGSPPYQPPEMEAIKGFAPEKRQSYDPFKMDYWSLGVILFVLFYGTVPFDDCSKHSLGFRDYEHALKEYSTKINPDFKRTANSKGPGGEYRFARKFFDPGVARIAWRLVDPDPATRYSMFDLFSDRTFQQAEMCVQENDHACNFCHRPECKGDSFKFAYGTDADSGKHKYRSASSASSISTTPGRSRRNTNNSLSAPPTPSSTDVPKVRSMIDIATEPKRSDATKVVAPPPKVDEAEEELDEDESNSDEDFGDDSTRVTKSDGSNGFATTEDKMSDVEDTLKPDKCADCESKESDSQAKSSDDPASDSPSSLKGDSTDSSPISAELLECLCTSAGVRKINLNLSDSSDGSLKLVPLEAIKLCGQCKGKHHNHLPKW